MRLITFLYFIFFIIGCSAKYEMPILNEFDKKEFIVKFDKKTTRLFVSNKNEEYKFVMIDSFGIPLSSKKFIDNKFVNLKFLPPDSRFEKLFLQVIFMVKNSMKENNFMIKSTKFEVIDVS